VEIPAVISQRLAHVLDGPATPTPAGVISANAAAADLLHESGGLTERERSVMRLLSAGLSNKEIGRQLNLSDNTVKFHLRNIFAKLNVTTRTAAVTASRNSGMLP
jgi:LuxR family maltose regulon positive regulatory protein